MDAEASSRIFPFASNQSKHGGENPYSLKLGRQNADYGLTGKVNRRYRLGCLRRGEKVLAHLAANLAGAAFSDSVISGKQCAVDVSNRRVCIQRMAACGVCSAGIDKQPLALR